MTSVIWFTLFLVTSFQLIEGQDNAHTRIPDYLLPCYRNQSLFHPENRPPMTMRTFIELVRKVENYERNNIEMVELATSMLHRFRLDGITRTPDVQESPGVIPWGVNGPQFFKHRLILKYLIPPNNYAFPNGSLTDVELCTLHFMLSSSIDNTERGDESIVCTSGLSNYKMGRGRKPRHLRFTRDINEKTDSEQVKKSETEDGSLKTSTQPQIKEINSTISDSELMTTLSSDTQTTVSWPTKKNVVEEPTTKSTISNDAQESDNVDVFNGTALDKEGNKGKFIFDDDLISLPRVAPVRSQTSETTTTSPPKRAADGQRKIGVQGNNYPESDCPVENGVIWTKWGAISAGPLLAGIAAGVYTQNIKISNLVRGGARESQLPFDLRNSDIDNRYAATLVGDLAEVTLMDGPKGSMTVGNEGGSGWNSTLFPRWYFVRKPANTAMTDAEIRGALDGLIMAKNIQEWKRRVPAGGLKLSQILERYYSEMGIFEPKYRACYRKELYTEVAKSSELKEQTYRFSEVLYEFMISGASIESDTMRSFANTAVNSLTSYIPSLGFSCPNKAIRGAEALNTKPFVNLTVVIDRSWDYSYIKSFVHKLMDDIDVRPYGSKMTLVDGKRFKPFFVDAENSLQIANFTYSEYSQRETGIDIPFALEQGIKESMKAVLDLEKLRGTSNGLPQVVLFIPQSPITLSDEDMTIAKDGIQHFKEYLPDVTFLYASPGNKENYQYLVINTNDDVFNIQYGDAETSIPVTVENIVKRIRKVPLRVTNPVCGSQWAGDSRKSQTTYYVEQEGIQFHRLHPNYFFGSESIVVRVQGYSYGTLQVCHSRQVEYPTNVTNDVQCKGISTNEPVDIEITKPCKGYKYITQCPPLYMSVAATATTTTAQCNDPECSFVTSVKYAIENDGTGCTAGVRGLLGNANLVSITLGVLLLLKHSVSLTS